MIASAPNGGASSVHRSPSRPRPLRECLALLHGEPCAYLGIVAIRDNSRIHRASWGRRAIAVKECVDAARHRPDPVSAGREFAALTALAESTSASGAPPLAPLPLQLCREHAVYAMTWVAGRSVTDVILARTTRTEQARATGASAGRWLRHLHDLRPLPPRRSDFEEKTATVERILAANRDRDALCRHAGETLIHLASRAAARPLPASWIHGDMKSDNLLIDGEQVTGLDVHLRTKTPSSMISLHSSTTCISSAGHRAEHGSAISLYPLRKPS